MRFFDDLLGLSWKIIVGTPNDVAIHIAGSAADATIKDVNEA